MARRIKKNEAIALTVLAGIGLVLQAFTFLFKWLLENWVVLIVLIAIAGVYAIFYFREKERKNLALRRGREQFVRNLNRVSISDDRNDYIFSDEDYRRGNKRENDYRKKYFLPLLNIFGNKCAKCGDSSNGIDLDHFVFSKNEGGNFSLLHKDGHLVNNAIPLCRACNRSKSDKSYRDFFNEEQILYLFTKNRDMTITINSENIPDS